MDENNIIKSCQRGNLEEFSRLYDKYSGKIYNFIYYKTFHKETAEDILSQVFLKALANIKKYNPETGAFSSWLYRISKNSVIDHYRTAKHHKNLDDIWDLSNFEDIEIDTSNRQILEKVKKYLKNFTKEQREIVILRIWEDLSYKEIAEIMDKSEDSCKMMFSRTINKLRQEIPLSIFISLIINYL